MPLLENDILTVRKYNFQRNYNFECILPPVGIIDPLRVSRLVQTVNYTDYTMASTEGMRYGAFQAFFSGFFNKTTFSISFMESEFHEVKRYLRAWRNLIVDDRGLFKKKKGFLFGYAKPIFLIYYNDKGLTTNVVRFKYAFPVVYNNWKADYNDPQIQKIEVNFVCDAVEDLREFVLSPIEDIITSKIPELFKTQ